MPPCNRYRKEQLVRQSIKRKWVSAQVEAISQPAVEQRGIAEEGGRIVRDRGRSARGGADRGWPGSLTLSWRTSDVESMSKGKLRITHYTWWRLQEDPRVIHASRSDGWTIQRPNADKVPVTTQAIRLRN